MKSRRNKACKICGGPYYAKDFCRKHYYQQPEVKAYQKEYRQRPEAKARQKEYSQRPEAKARQKEYSQRPEAKARRREYRQRPEAKARRREYRQRPEVKARLREYYRQRPEVKARRESRKSKTCKICGGPHKAKGFCGKHYYQQRTRNLPFLLDCFNKDEHIALETLCDISGVKPPYALKVLKEFMELDLVLEVGENVFQLNPKSFLRTAVDGYFEEEEKKVFSSKTSNS